MFLFINKVFFNKSKLGPQLFIFCLFLVRLPILFLLAVTSGLDSCCLRTTGISPPPARQSTTNFHLRHLSASYLFLPLPPSVTQGSPTACPIAVIMSPSAPHSVCSYSETAWAGNATVHLCVYLLFIFFMYLLIITFNFVYMPPCESISQM